MPFLRNLTNYPCFNTEVWKKRCFPFKNGLLFPAPPIQCLKSEEIVGSFQHCIGDGGEVRQIKLYSRLPCAQKRRKCKFVPRLLSMIADSRPSRFTVNVPVVSASASNWQVLHLVWCSLQEFSKKVKNYSRKSRWFTNHAKVNAYFTDHGKIENSFPRTEKYRFTNHGKNKSSFALHAKQKWPLTRHEESMGDPQI